MIIAIEPVTVSTQGLVVDHSVKKAEQGSEPADGRISDVALDLPWVTQPELGV